ncbi:hypothetical protein Tco_0285487 [Tanacetum coccineum]
MTSSSADESQNHPEKTQTQNVQQIVTTTISNNNAKFPYLEKDEYETWAMKMEYWIMNSDHHLWNVVLNGNNKKNVGRDPKGNIIIFPPISAEEQIAVQRETKARTLLLQSLPEDHMADFHHLDDEGISGWLSKPDLEVAITLKAKGGLDYLNFDDLYNKLKSLEIDIKGGSSYKSNHSAAPSHSAFVPMFHILTLESNGGFNRFEKEVGRKKNLTKGKLAQCTGKQVESNARYSAFKIKELEHDKPADHKALLSVDSMVNWLDHEESADDKHLVTSQVLTCPFGCHDKYAELKKEFDDLEVQYKEYYIQVQAYKNTLKTLEQQKACDKSLKPKTNDFASCDSSDKSSSPKSVESSVFSPRVVESESNLKTAAQEDISFNNNTPSVSFVKDDKHSSFGCNKNGLRHCVKNKVSGFKSCFICRSFSHLIKDCDFYENKMGVYSVQRESRPMWNNVDNIPPFIPQAAHGRFGNVTFPAGSVTVPTPIPAGRQTGPAPVYAGTLVPAGRQNRPAPVHADRPFPAGRRNSVSVSASWRNNAARPISRPTSSYFQNYSRPVYYDQMYMGEGRWGTAVKSSAGKILFRIHSGWLRASPGGARVPTGSFTGSYWLTTSYWLSSYTGGTTPETPSSLARDVVGNDLTTAEQLIGLIKNQLAAAHVPAA